MVVFRRQPHGEAKLAQVGTTIYVLHPDQPAKVMTLPHASLEAAAISLAKIRRDYFSDWTVVSETDDEVDPTTWALSEEEHAQAAARDQLVRQGWVREGTTMVMPVRRERDGLNATIANAQDITTLHVLLGLEDGVDPLRRPALLARLAQGALPALTELTLESPWLPRMALAAQPLSVPKALVERLDRLAAIGVGVWPLGAVARLTHLRVQSNFTPEEVTEIAKAPLLRTLQIGMSRRAEAAARIAFPAMHLDKLTIELLEDVGAMIHALLGGNVPALVQLQGKPGPKLASAIERWQREQPDKVLRTTFDSPFKPVATLLHEPFRRLFV
ncbi:hypothetical protein BH11MYX2_BH11MYX2_00150 [soil metagenome]